jgi:hypothetical protein
MVDMTPMDPTMMRLKRVVARSVMVLVSMKDKLNCFFISKFWIIGTDLLSFLLYALILKVMTTWMIRLTS